MSIYSLKTAGNACVQPWVQIIALFPGGGNVSPLFDLYSSFGDAVLIGSNSVPTLLDGPEKIVRYGALTLGDGTTPTSLTAANRCKGLTILCDSLTVKNNATLHMTGRGARVDRNDDPFFPFMDYKIPFKICLDSSRLTLAQAMGVIKSMGLAPWDTGTFQHVVAGMFGFNCAISLAGTVTLLSATGCGSFTTGAVGFNTSATGVIGNAGTGGGMGSGGSGGLWGNSHTSTYRGGAATPYSGGSGSGGVGNTQGNPCGGAPGSPYSGPGGHGGITLSWGTGNMPFPGDTVTLSAGYGGGGAGNPGGKQGQNSYSGQADGGTGVGGKLTIISRGAVTVQSGGKIEANGSPGGAGGPSTGVGYGGGGGSGGGHISILTPVLTNSGTIQAAGGAGGIGASAGGAGGAGSVVTKSFSDMGW